MTAPIHPPTPREPAPVVLVADDMAANRAVMARRLEKFDYAVMCVESGNAALAMLDHSRPDILLLDYMMPRMNGIEVLRELRARPATRDLPVIMVTARAESAAVVEALAAGADDYVTKPIDFDVLRARIETQLAKRSDAALLQCANAALDHRITLRSMALADLECELQDEIGHRRLLEQKLAASGIAPPRSRRDDQPGTWRPSRPEPGKDKLTAMLNDIIARLDGVIDAGTTGKTASQAQLAELKTLLAEARYLAGPSSLPGVNRVLNIST